MLGLALFLVSKRGPWTIAEYVTGRQNFAMTGMLCNFVRNTLQREFV